MMSPEPPTPNVAFLIQYLFYQLDFIFIFHLCLHTVITFEIKADFLFAFFKFLLFFQVDLFLEFTSQMSNFQYFLGVFPKT